MEKLQKVCEKYWGVKKITCEVYRLDKTLPPVLRILGCVWTQKMHVLKSVEDVRVKACIWQWRLFANSILITGIPQFPRFSI